MLEWLVIVFLTLAIGTIITFFTLFSISDKANRITTGFAMILGAPLVLLISFLGFGGGIGAGAVASVIVMPILISSVIILIIGGFTSNKYRPGALEKVRAQANN
ncbi:hypothetical protein [Halobacillus sp. K22]|uniref:hypothetical protein n=1 Tax=Halobacillus sp. K22 TaxID=3457431 RepID=UPI003FCDEAE9